MAQTEILGKIFDFLVLDMFPSFLTTEFHIVIFFTTTLNHIYPILYLFCSRMDYMNRPYIVLV